MAAADYYDDVQKVYVAYYGRPADREGLLYWADKLDAANGNLSEIIDSFGNSAEATTLFGGLTVEQMVSAIYTQLFNRLPDPEGLDFYSQGIMNGTFTLASVMLDVLNGAKNADIAIINAKLTAADAFTDTFFDGVNDTEEVLAYSGDDAAALAREWLAPVIDATTATTAEGEIATVLDEMGGATTGETLVLTDSVDNVVIAAGNTVDTVIGVVDPGTGTYSVGDNIDGNGHTILKLAIADDGANSFASVKDIATVQLINAATGTASFEAGGWSNIGEIVMDSGTAGGAAAFTNLEAGVDLLISVDGTLEANYTDGEMVSLQADKGDSLSLIDGDLAITAAEGNSAYVQITGTSDLTVGTVSIDAADSTTVSVDLTSSADLVVGDITVTGGDSASMSIDAIASGDLTLGDVMATIGSGTSASFWLEATSSGDMTVGDITIEGGASASASVDLYNEGGSITVGNVVMSIDPDATATSGYLGFFVENNTATGDVTIGDITMSVGASQQLSVSVSNSGTSGDSLGSLTVGDLDLTVGNDSTGSLFIEQSTTVTAGTETMGGLTVGAMELTLGADATFEVDIESYVWGASATADAQGAVSVGDANVTLGIGASLDYSISVENTASGDIGEVTIGNVTIDADDGASIDWYNYVFAWTGDVASVTVGDLDVTLGVDASLSYTSEVTGENIGDVVIGDVNLLVGKSGYVTMEYTVSATTDIASVTVGDVNVELGASATVTSFSYDITAGGDIGTVAFGDLTVAVGASADFDDYSITVDAGGSVDSVTIGNVEATVGSNGSFSYDLAVSGDDGVSEVTLGDFTLVADGASSLSIDLSVSALSGDVGTVTVGDLDLTATDATIYFEVNVTASGDAGTIEIGNIDITVTDSASVSISIDSNVAATDANVHIAGFALNGTELTAANFVLNIGETFTGDVTIDNITVAVSATVAGLFDLSDILTDVSTTGAVTLGTVDYSDYALTGTSSTGAVIDVSGYAGDIVVIGSALDDIITDNDETNTLTGGDGADTFSFVNMDANGSGLTLAAADVITDFEHAVDIIELDIDAGTFSADTYFEGSAASFSAFLTLAETQMTSSPEDNLVAVQVGSDVYVAVDMDGGDEVDTVIVLTGVTTSSLNFADFAFV